jgi:hypothetical protein
MPVKKAVKMEKKKWEFGWGKAILAGFAYAIIAQIIHMVEAYATMDYYIDPSYYQMWSRFMMPGAGAPPMEFFMMSMLFGTFVGILLAYVYQQIKGSIPADNAYFRGMKFGWILFLVAGIPGFLMMYSILGLPFGLIFAWLLSGLAIYVVGGAAIAKIVEY